MRLLVFLLVLLSSTVAHSAALTSATWFGSFQGTPFTLTTGGGGLVATGSATGTTANVQLTVTPQLFTTLQTAGIAPAFLSQTLGGSQTIAVTGGGVAANQGVAGGLRNFIGTNASGVLLFSVPSTIGVTPAGGNPFAQTSGIVPGAVNVRFDVSNSFFAWTTGGATVTGTLSGVTTTTIQSTGSNGLAGGVGSLTLIAPAVVNVCLAVPVPCDGSVAQATSVSVTRLVLSFPEPTTGLLLAAAVLGVAARRRRTPRG